MCISFFHFRQLVENNQSIVFKDRYGEIWDVQITSDLREMKNPIPFIKAIVKKRGNQTTLNIRCDSLGVVINTDTKKKLGQFNHHHAVVQSALKVT